MKRFWILEQPQSASEFRVKQGFSWPALSLGVFWFFGKGLYGRFLFWSAAFLVTFGMSWFVAPFYANEELVHALLRRGYRIREGEFRKRPTDILALGVLFFLSALFDLYIIMAFPRYGLKIFGTEFSGAAGWIVKLQSPFIHTFLGLGFLSLSLWAYYLFLFYMLFGIVNAAVNYAVIGFGWIRSIFIVGSVIFLIYVYRRREVFHGAEEA